MENIEKMLAMPAGQELDCMLAQELGYKLYQEILNTFIEPFSLIDPHGAAIYKSNSEKFIWQDAWAANVIPHWSSNLDELALLSRKYIELSFYQGYDNLDWIGTARAASALYVYNYALHNDALTRVSFYTKGFALTWAIGPNPTLAMFRAMLKFAHENKNIAVLAIE